MPFLRERRRQAEWMDRPDADPRELAASLAFIRKVNRWLRYTRATLGHLKRFAGTWSRGERIEVLDIATGSADIPSAIARWGIEAGFDVRVTGVDFHAETIAVARSEVQGATSDSGRAPQAERLQEGTVPISRVRLVRADAFRLPFENGAVDYAITNMFLHHLDPPEIVGVLREMDRVARRGVIVADLLRSYRAYAWVKLLTALSPAMVRHDAAVSVGQAFTRGEILCATGAAGLTYARYYRHFGHRFVLAGEKPRR
ncbi:MAG TPA: methyltransferase domain-containing protein [Tepidisphaeraceae bacterium]|nr:methyltransferase domain-containing protein [Tepidisphaeraceae bacterium]